MLGLWTRRAVAVVAWTAIGLTAFEAVSRQLVRTHAIGWLPDDPSRLAAWPAVALLLLVATRRRPDAGAGATRSAPTAAVLAALLAAGLSLQLAAGARLQSDGFYYYAYLRSLAFDGDVNFLNDYRLLGLDDKPHLFEPTETGHAPSAWTIGPAFVWAPFFAAGHAVATGLAAGGASVATDGTSYPYRQSVVIAGLLYALLGAWFTLRLVRRFFTGATPAVAVAATLAGSFALWYALVEPTMTHAPSMAAIAGFVWAWVSSRHGRSLAGWTALGALAGFAALIRWQNALFALLPAVEAAVALAGSARRGDRETLRRTLVAGTLFTVAAVIAFIPQMLAWKAIYGSYLAVSPLGPALHWSSPQWIDVLFSSRNGLLAMSPVLWIGLAGLVAFAVRHPATGVPMLVVLAAMTYFNSAIHDWWGSDGFGGRRFDGVLPMLTLGTAAAFEAGRAFFARRPQVAAGVLLAAVLLWHLALMRAAVAGEVRLGEAIDFREVGGRQARTLHGWFGHPFTYPASLWFAASNGVSPASWDLLRAMRFLSDPTRPYGRIDVGTDDELYLAGGWHGPERDAEGTFRWATATATARVPLDRRAALDLQIRLRAFDHADAPRQTLTIDTGRRRFGPLAVPADWTTLTVETPAEAWRAGVNRLALTFSYAARPSEVTGGGDTRDLAAAVDYIRVAERPAGRTP